MKFVVISSLKHPVPPEMVIPLIDAFLAYISKYTESGHIEDSWAFAGTDKGGATFNADSLEELDAIIAEYPFGPFSEVEIYPVVNLQESLQRAKQVAQTLMEAMAQMGAG
jgi:muconolactone delta-isomerase